MLRATATCFLCASLLTAQKVPEVRIDVGAPTGGSASNWPRLAISGVHVYAVWTDYRAGAGRIFANRSANAGGAWQTPDFLVPTTAAPADRPVVAADGEAVHVIAWSGGIVSNHSLDAGQSWQPSGMVLDAPAPGHQPQLGSGRIASSGAVVAAGWSSYETAGGFAYWCQVSADHGATWLSNNVRLDAGLPAGTANNAGQLRVAVAGQTVLVVWRDLRPSATGLYCNRSLDAGATWLAAPVRLTAVPSSPGDPELVFTGPDAHVAWSDLRTGAPRVLYQRSADAGATWQALEQRLDTGVATNVLPGSVAVASDGMAVHVVWSQVRNNDAIREIYANRSLDGGATWRQNDQKLSAPVAPSTWVFGEPRVAVLGTSVTAAWLRSGTGPPYVTSEVWFSRSLDAGTSWAPSRRLDQGSSPAGLAFASNLGLAAGDGTIHALWADARNGQNDVFFTIASGWQPYGTGVGGTGSAMPALRATGVAMAGATFALDVTGGLGGAPALLGIGFGPATKIAVPLLSGTLLVQPAFSAFVLLDATGAASLPIAVPANPGMFGLDLNSQAFVLDAGAAQGAAMSNAIEVWIG